MADDFRCQVKQIIADFKAAERITGDISEYIISIAVPVKVGIGYTKLTRSPADRQESPRSIILITRKIEISISYT